MGQVGWTSLTERNLSVLCFDFSAILPVKKLRNFTEKSSMKEIPILCMHYAIIDFTKKEKKNEFLRFLMIANKAVICDICPGGRPPGQISEIICPGG